MPPVVENPASRSPDPGPYLRAVGSGALDEIVAGVRKRGCLDPAMTLYGASVPVTVKGWNARVLKKGQVFFKAFPGFVSSGQLAGYAAAHASDPSWFGNAAVSLLLAAGYWGGLVAFVATRDIRVLDWYDASNMERVLKLLRGAGMRAEAEHVRVTAGFMPLEPQMKALSKMYRGKWDQLYVFTQEVPPELNVSRCSPETLDRFNPLAMTTRSFAVDKKIWPVLSRALSKHNIAGFIRRNARSSLEETGVMYQEELVVSAGMLGTAYAEDPGHPAHWRNWPLAALEGLPYEGLVLRMRLPKRVFTDPLEAPNDNFALLRYVLGSRGATPAGTSMAGVATYNVAALQPPDAALDRGDALSWLARAVRGCRGAFAFALQEVPVDAVREVRKAFADNGWTGFKSVRNGGPGVTVCLAVRAAGARMKALPTAGRTQIVADTPRGRVCAVHLDIGERRRAGLGVEEENGRIDEANARLRESVIRDVLEAGPDIILGDFNFAPGDPEDLFLASRGYARATPDGPRTTPHNRVDHVYVRGGLEAGRSLTMPSPASDHSAVFQEVGRAVVKPTRARRSTRPARGGQGTAAARGARRRDVRNR